MMYSKALFVILSICLVGVPLIAVGKTGAPCNCSKVVGQCLAEIFMNQSEITVTSNSAQCSQVIWYADEHPNITIVLNGRESEEWLGVSKEPNLSVQSCNICLDLREHQSTADMDMGSSRPLELAGHWLLEGHCDYNRSPDKFDLNLKVDVNGKVSGTYDDAPIIEGNVQGQNIMFSVDFKRFFFTPVNTIEYSGTVDLTGNRMSGSYTQSVRPGASCSWKAKRPG